MTYTALNIVFLLVAGAFALVAHRIASRRRHENQHEHDGDGARSGRVRRPRLVAGLATLAVMLVLTVVFDSVIVGVGLVAYDPARISGVYVGRAPVEDLAYTVGAVLVLPALWRLLGTRSGRRGRTPGRDR
ncbi:lycopene cyclase domain-containing protein [Tersicoccus sp. Bi-70]|uniref:lycopene cyclase domain-containing protein n=1 Tax=Tersicoccus sp. Bi-70 TaxID=1897634 RepID=UPI00097835E7|nr:lycopene cyclase domain-containing protein [Tersicoccus sp. Bi-70]OMH32432.1 hypothetical protein BGP79_08485 [Tersicoccus sp. Bi-70]